MPAVGPGRRPRAYRITRTTASADKAELEREALRPVGVEPVEKERRAEELEPRTEPGRSQQTGGGGQQRDGHERARRRVARRERLHARRHAGEQEEQYREQPQRAGEPPPSRLRWLVREGRRHSAASLSVSAAAEHSGAVVVCSSDRHMSRSDTTPALVVSPTAPSTGHAAVLRGALRAACRVQRPRRLAPRGPRRVATAADGRRGGDGACERAPALRGLPRVAGLPGAGSAARATGPGRGAGRARRGARVRLGDPCGGRPRGRRRRRSRPIAHAAGRWAGARGDRWRSHARAAAASTSSRRSASGRAWAAPWRTWRASRMRSPARASRCGC